jgi:general secretion pathway protein D
MVCALVAALAVPALAAVALNSVAISTEGNGGVRVTLAFAGAPPKYQVTGAGSTEVSILMQDATIATTVPPTIAGSGAIRAISVTQNGGSAAVSLHLTTAAPLRVQPVGQFIIVEIRSSGGALGGRRGPAVAAQPPPATGLGQVTEVVPLKYADVSEVAGILVQGANVASNDTFTPQTSNFGTQSFGGSFGNNGNTFQPPQNFGQNNQFGNNFGGQSQGLAQRLSDNIAIDRRLNAVILTGPPDVVSSLRAVIDKIDVPLDSVLLETQIIELDEQGAKDVGLDFNAGTTTAAQASISLENTTFPTSKATLQANLYALISQGQGRILAKPRILAQNGEEASILTGDALPIVTQVVVAGSAAISGSQVNYINVGVNLQIQPRISADGYVTSHIYAEVSSVTGQVQSVPEISQRQAVTSATVKDGESFVIGGLLQDNEIKTVYKIPGLGDIPLIGGLFRRLSSTMQHTNLYIIVTPHIIPRHSSP